MVDVNARAIGAYRYHLRCAVMVADSNPLKSLPIRFP
jgi:hypothetical protein